MTDSIQLEDVCCPLCGRKSDEVVLVGSDLFHDLPGSFTIVKCCACGLMRTNPRPTPETIGFYYPDDYGPYLASQVRRRTPTSDIKRRLKPLVKRIFNFNSMTLPALAPGRMLEIGCASGAFLHQMASQGWQVEGIEFSSKAAQAAKQLGYPVQACSLEAASTPNEPFDLVVGWMVLEHLHDPVSGLQKLREWAKPEAWLVLSVPNAGSLEFQLFKNKWYALHLPNHLFHFTPTTLKKILSAGGWKLESLHHQRTLSNVIASTGYVLRSKGYFRLGKKLIDFPERGGWMVYALYPLAWLLSLFGQTGRMTVWAKVK